MPKTKQPLVGVGIYSVPLAARLARMRPATIHRWLFGYSREHGGEVRHYSRLWKGELSKYRGVGALTFTDLMELRVIRQFLDAGVSIHLIRAAGIKAKREFETRHPFSTRLFRTDGRTIFADLPHPSGSRGRAFLDIIKDQWAFNEVVKPALLNLDYPDNDPASAPVRWWPRGRSSEVVIDPRRSFGRPIVTNEGIRTSVLAGMSENNSIKELTNWFGVSERAVRDARQFEEGLAA